MRAIRVHESGGIDTMLLDEIPRPVPGAGEVLVAVKGRASDRGTGWSAKARAASVRRCP